MMRESQLAKSEVRVLNRRIGILALAVVAGILALIVLLPSPPSYQGKTLSEWLKSLDKTPLQFFNGAPKPDQPAADAFRAIGTNTIPFLRAELRAKDSWLKKKLTQWLKKPSLNKMQFTRAEVRHKRAVSACQALGPLAEELVPELSVLLNSTYDPVDESFALSAAGPEALPALTNSFANSNMWVRMRAASAFRYVRYDAQAAIPALIKCLDDREPNVKCEAACALAYIGKRADLVVPLLIRNLDDTNSSVRWRSAYALGFFGEQAKDAVPALLRKMKEDPHVRTWGGTSLKKIDPEAAAQAEAK